MLQPKELIASSFRTQASWSNTSVEHVHRIYAGDVVLIELSSWSLLKRQHRVNTKYESYGEIYNARLYIRYMDTKLLKVNYNLNFKVKDNYYYEYWKKLSWWIMSRNVIFFLFFEIEGTDNLFSGYKLFSYTCDHVWRYYY